MEELQHTLPITATVYHVQNSIHGDIIVKILKCSHAHVEDRCSSCSHVQLSARVDEYGAPTSGLPGTHIASIENTYGWPSGVHLVEVLQHTLPITAMVYHVRKSINGDMIVRIKK